MPDLLPIRMLNEHLYCPRLFHLMHVQGLWGESGDTVEGRAQHNRAAARQPSKPPLPEEEAQPWPAPPRNLEMGSDELGLIGKLDALEESSDGASRHWVPVEGKHSAPPEADRPIMAGDIELARGAWNNDQIQLCAQGLLLRANGYASGFGYLYYRKTKQRVRIDFDDRLVEATHAELAKARATEGGPIPLPLVDSPKCPRCSLHAICLPDETNWLLRRTGEPPVAVMPARDDRGVLYISEPGTYVGKRSHCVVILPPGDGPSREIPMKDVGHISLAGAVQASTQLIQEALESGRSISWLSAGGRYLGGAHPPLAKNLHIRRAQFRLLDDPVHRLVLSRSVVLAKIMNQRTLLRRNGPKNHQALHDLRERMHEARRATGIDALMGVEGMAARIYFPAFAALLRDQGGQGFDWNGRNRRPPRDPINAMLSLAYSILLRDVETALRNAGLDPQIGFFHSAEDGKPALALDLMEAYRPLVADSMVLRAINSGTLTSTDFLILPGQASMKISARKRFFSAYEQRMAECIRHPRFRYSISYRRTLELEARLLARHLEGELPDYLPLITR